MMTTGRQIWGALVAGVAAGFLVSLPEGVAVAVRVTDTGAAGLLLCVCSGMLVGMGGAAGAVLAALVLVPGGFSHTVESASRFMRTAVWEDATPQQARTLLGLQGALLIGTGQAVLTWYFAGRWVVSHLHSEKLMALAMLLLFAALLVAAAISGWLVWRGMGFLLARLDLPTRDREMIVLLLPTLSCLVVGGIVGGHAAFRLAATVGWTWVLELGVAAGLGALAALLAPRPSARLPLAPSICMVLLLVAGFSTLGNWTAARLPVQSHGHLSRWVLARASALSDVDGDGFGSLFGGTDCAPWNSEISPGAREIPGNGVDENCSGGDGAQELRMGERAGPELRARVEKLFSRSPNVLMISWDAARADRFSYRGYRPQTTPVIDKLAARSAVFLEAYAPGPNTHSSVPAILTGKNIFSVALRKDEKSRMMIVLEDENHTLAEMFSDLGYHTAAVVSHRFFGKKYRWNQGFDEYHLPVRSKHKTISSPKVTKKALKVIAKHRKKRHKRQPLFLWVHYYDPHSTYMKHKGTPFSVRSKSDRYDSEMWFTDKHNEKVLARMRRLKGETVVVFLADHGDELGEHGKFGQHKTVHRENLHVPLIFHVPGVPPAMIHEPVSLIDIYPTLADIVGAELPEGVRGRSLLQGIFEGTMPDRGPVFSEVAWRFESPPEHWIAVTAANARLLKEVRSGRRELYYIDVDPMEQMDRAGEGYDEEQQLDEAVRHFLDATTVLTADMESIP